MIELRRIISEPEKKDFLRSPETQVLVAVLGGIIDEVKGRIRDFSTINQETMDQNEPQTEIIDINQKLIALLEGENPSEPLWTKLQTIEEVVETMEKMDRICRLDQDGLKAFNGLYKEVTLEIKEYCRKGQWKSPQWMVALDVEFAKLYFEGILACLTKNSRAPLAWKALMDNRFKKGVSKVQFALAGINAHINRDLMIAILQAFKITQGKKTGVTEDNLKTNTPEYEDFLEVDKILDRVEKEALKTLSQGRMKTFLDATGGVALPAAMKVVSACRGQSWSGAQKLHELQSNPHAQRNFINSRDRLAAKIAQLLLVPIE